MKKGKEINRHATPGDSGYETYRDIISEISDIGVDRYVAVYGNNLSPLQMLALTDVVYRQMFGAPDEDRINTVRNLIIGDPRYEPGLERLPAMEPYIETLQPVIDKMIDDEDGALADMEKLSAANPDVPELGVSYINLLRDFEKMQDAGRLTECWYNRAPDNPAVRLLYAEWLITREQYDEFFAFFGGNPGLDAISTGSDAIFSGIMVAEFCACYILAWLAKDNISNAEPYYRILTDMDDRTALINNALMAMMTKRNESVLKRIKQ